MTRDGRFVGRLNNPFTKACGPHIKPVSSARLKIETESIAASSVTLSSRKYPASFQSPSAIAGAGKPFRTLFLSAWAPLTASLWFDSGILSL